MDADVRRGVGVSQMRTDADKGGGGQNRPIFCGRPLCTTPMATILVSLQLIFLFKWSSFFPQIPQTSAQVYLLLTFFFVTPFWLGSSDYFFSLKWDMGVQKKNDYRIERRKLKEQFFSDFPLSMAVTSK